MQEYQKLNKNAKKSWIISRLLGALITSIILISFKLFLSKVIDNFDEINIFVTVGIIIFITILLINSIIYPIFEYKQWRYTITNDKIEFTELPKSKESLWRITLYVCIADTADISLTSLFNLSVSSMITCR